MVPCLDCLSQGRSWLGQGDLSVASLHPVRVWFIMVFLVGRLHPQYPLTASWQHTHQTSVIFPKILPKFEVGATGRCRA